MAQSWLTSLNPFELIRRWFTIGAMLWLVLSASLIALYFSRNGIRVSAPLAIYLSLTVACSIIAFILYGVDKRRAIKKQPRISERTLHVLSLLGGWPGAHLATRVFHHKTQKFRFRMVFWLTVMIHLTIIGYGIYYGWPMPTVRSFFGMS